MTKYQVIAHGGFLWDLTHNVPKIFDTNTEAEEYGKYLLSTVSKGERKYYRPRYRVKELSDDKAHLIKLTGVF
jgi:hypothetical protein